MENNLNTPAPVDDQENREEDISEIYLLIIMFILAVVLIPTCAHRANSGADNNPETTVAPIVAAVATDNPTMGPTPVPTVSPTHAIVPTAAPTAEPTVVPTAEPTATPTAEPTAEPTPTPAPDPTPMRYQIDDAWEGTRYTDGVATVTYYQEAGVLVVDSNTPSTYIPFCVPRKVLSDVEVLVFETKGAYIVKKPRDGYSWNKLECLREIHFNGRVASIEEFSFTRWARRLLRKVAFYDDVEYIGHSAFGDVTDIVCFYGDVGVLELTFNWWDTIHTVIFHGKVHKLDRTFRHNYSVQEVIFFGDVDELSCESFAGTTNLHTMMFYGGIGAVDRYVFGDVPGEIYSTYRRGTKLRQIFAGQPDAISAAFSDVEWHGGDPADILPIP